MVGTFRLWGLALKIRGKKMMLNFQGGVPFLSSNDMMEIIRDEVGAPSVPDLAREASQG